MIPEIQYALWKYKCYFFFAPLILSYRCNFSSFAQSCKTQGHLKRWFAYFQESNWKSKLLHGIALLVCSCALGGGLYKTTYLWIVPCSLPLCTGTLVGRNMGLRQPKNTQISFGTHLILRAAPDQYQKVGVGVEVGVGESQASMPCNVRLSLWPYGGKTCRKFLKEPVL